MSHLFIYYNEYASYGWLAFQNCLRTHYPRMAQPDSMPLCQTHDETAISTCVLPILCSYFWQHLQLRQLTSKTSWDYFSIAEEWWTEVGTTLNASTKGFRFIIMLVFWELWKEKEGSITFDGKQASSEN